MQSGHIVNWSNMQKFQEYYKLENFLPFLRLLHQFEPSSFQDLLNALIDLFTSLLEFQEIQVTYF
jgi:hypothetical protein